jgi:hypothetical protein
MCRFSRCLQRGRRPNSRLSNAEVGASCRLWRIGSCVRIWRNRCRSSRTSEPVRHAGRFAFYNMCLQGSEDWLYCDYFPEAKSRDFADLWPPDAIVSEMTATGFTGVEAERWHVHRERDLAELWSVVRSASGTHNCCHYRTLRIRPACGGSNATSTIGRRPGRAPTTCAHRGGRRHCKIAPIGQQHSPRLGCSAGRRFASPRGSRYFSGRGIPAVSPI